MAAAKPLTISVLRSWAAANIHKDKTVKKENYMCSSAADNYVMDTYKFPSLSGSWSQETLDPAGLLSFCLWLRDPLYKAGEGLLRRQLLNEGYISMREVVERAAPPRKRKRIIEMFERGHADAEPADVRAYWETWASILGCQFVRINSRDGDKRISFVPADISRWSADNVIYYVDEGMETIFMPPNNAVGRKGLGQYISDREAEGWTVEWPIVDGTKDELEQKILPLLNILNVSEKAKKAELGRLLGRHEAIVRLHKIGTQRSIEDEF